MAVKPENVSNGVAADASYPNGSGQDEVVPGVSQDGTVLEETLFNDIQGALQSKLTKENITASDVPDTVLVSQYRDADSALAARGGDFTAADISDTETCVLGKINRFNNSGGAITVDLPTSGLYAGAVVLFDEFSDALYSVNSVTFDAGSAIIGAGSSPVQTVELTTDDLKGGFRRNKADDRWIPFKTELTGTEI